MKVTQNKSKSRPKNRIADKLAKLAGGGAVAAAMSGMPAVADADIVQSTTAPISSGGNGTNFWDVDGDGTNDFALRGGVNVLDNNAVTARFDDLNGGRLVVPSDANAGGIARLPGSVSVGANLGTAYQFHFEAQGRNYITVDFGVARNARDGGWTFFGETGFFGFRFTSGGDTFFGWGELTIGGPNGSQGFTINRAFYNDTAGESIRVGATSSVPEPSGLAVLGMLAAGTFARRRRK